jgi:hypothetical protein
MHAKLMLARARPGRRRADAHVERGARQSRATDSQPVVWICLAHVHHASLLRSLKLGLLFGVLLPASSPAFSADMAGNLLVNGDLRVGAGNAPANWHKEGWKKAPEYSSGV